MSDIVIQNNEPEQEGATAKNPPIHDGNREEAPFSKSEEIHSKDFTDIKPLCASRYGNSRLFTAQSNGRKVVLKCLKPTRAKDPRCQTSLREEYDMTAALDNKFVRKAIDFINIQGLGDCIVFEYIDGKTLAEHVRVGTLSEKQMKNVLVDICDGLNYMHRNQVVHSNLKPENIIVNDSDCRAKIIDIGKPETDEDTDRELLIKEMDFVAPEIIKGVDIDPRSDIYSLGKIMEFICERNISRQYIGIATHCTQFSKEQRYNNVSEVRSAIGKGHSLLKVLLLILLAALIGGLAFIYVPKIKASVEQERAERMAADFEREVRNMEKELPGLCQKYKLNTITEPLRIDWSDDSLRFAQSLMPFFASEEYKAKAMQAMERQKASIVASRKKDYDALLLAEFKNATDSLALALKEEVPLADDSLLLKEAVKWFIQIK